MALDSGQRRIVRRIKQIGREVGASPKEVKAALETGRVESGFRNLPGGDADSAGWRQERASLYPNPTDLDASIRRFYDETKAVKAKYGRSGDLAAAVQRPAAQYRGRYQAVSGEAQALLGGAVGAGGGSASSGAPPPGSAPTRAATPGVDNSALRGQAIAQFLGRRNQDPLDFALTIRGLQDVASSGQSAPGSVRASTTGRPASPSLSPGGNGAFKITGPNPGRLKPELVSFAKRVAGEYGRTLTGSDGTGHSRLTVNGNVSQHTTGNATDIPASGRELIRMGRAALIAAGMPRSQAMKQTGGLYNVNGHQVIFATNQGGNHFDHLHISAR